MNGIYGKTIEDVEKHVDVKICKGKKEYIKHKSKLGYAGDYKIKDDIYLVKNRKKVVNLNKFIYLGKAILDLSKLMIMQFVHDDLFRVYGQENVTIFCTDTDSIHCMVENYSTDEYYSKYDEFNFPIDKSGVVIPHGTFRKDNKNQGLLGSMKDEGQGVPIMEGEYIRPKQYYERYANAQEI